MPLSLLLCHLESWIAFSCAFLLTLDKVVHMSMWVLKSGEVVSKKSLQEEHCCDVTRDFFGLPERSKFANLKMGTKETSV